MSIPAKLNPNAATLSQLDEVLMASRVQHAGRATASKRSTAPVINPCQSSADHQTSTSHYGTRSARLKEKVVHRNTSKKLDSDSEEVYTAPSMQEQLSPMSVQSNNSAMGDYYRSSSKQAKVRNKLHRKYHRLLDERALDGRNIYLWRLALSVLLLGVLIFVIYRCLSAVWPKPKKTLLERVIDDLFGFFTL